MVGRIDGGEGVEVVVGVLGGGVEYGFRIMKVDGCDVVGCDADVVCYWRREPLYRICTTGNPGMSGELNAESCSWRTGQRMKTMPEWFFLIQFHPRVWNMVSWDIATSARTGF